MSSSSQSLSPEPFSSTDVNTSTRLSRSKTYKRKPASEDTPESDEAAVLSQAISEDDEVSHESDSDFKEGTAGEASDVGDASNVSDAGEASGVEDCTPSHPNSENIQDSKQEKPTRISKTKSEPAESATVTTSKKARITREKEPTMTRFESDMRALLSKDRGYARIFYDQVNVRHLSLVYVTMSSEKMEMYRRANNGRDPMQKTSIYVNSMFNSLPSGDDEVFRKFLVNPDRLQSEPYHAIGITPPGKIKYPILTGVGSFGKKVYPADSLKASHHEFAFCLSALQEQFVDEATGHDTSCLKWFDAVNNVWNRLSTIIAESPKMAPRLKEACARQLALEASPSSASSSSPVSPVQTTSPTGSVSGSTPGVTGFTSHTEARDRFTSKFKELFCKKFDASRGVDFKSKFFRKYVEAEHPGGYKAPTPALQQVFEDAGKHEKLVYNDMPVVRPKTSEEVDATWESDPNPFVYVPITERGVIVSGSYVSVLYEYGITEDAKEKSHLKLRPLVVVWFRDFSVKPATGKKQSKFTFGKGEVSANLVELDATPLADDGEIRDN